MKGMSRNWIIANRDAVRGLWACSKCGVGGFSLHCSGYCQSETYEHSSAGGNNIIW